MSIQFELLTILARTTLSAREIIQARELVPQVRDWQAFLQLAGRHKVLPRLYLGVRKHCKDLVDTDLLKGLEGYFYHNGRKNYEMADLLIMILGLLEGDGIDAVPFKGPVLAETMFGGLEYRSFADLDLLVCCDDSWSAIQLLLSNGFSVSPELTFAQFGKFAEGENEISLIHSDSGYAIDLHWDLSGCYLKNSFGLETLSCRLKVVRFGDRDVLVMSDEDTLISLSVHGNCNAWDKLDHVCSIAETLRSCPNLDWGYVVDATARLGAKIMLHVSLMLAAELQSAPLPDNILRQITGERKTMKLVDHAAGLLSRQESAAFPTRFTIWHLRCREGVKDGIRFMFRIIFVPTVKEWYYLPLPPALSFLYYILRPARLLFETMVWTKQKLTGTVSCGGRMMT